MKTNVLYIHGFNSSPNSAKAVQMKDHINKEFPEVEVYVPQLPTTPDAAISLLESIVLNKMHDKWVFIGSSLGGYFATYLSEKFDGKAVLINPAVKPYELLADYIGEQTNPYSGEVYQVTAAHMTQLKNVDVKQVQRPENFYLLAQEGDEVLDYRQAKEKYKHSLQTIQSGGDHSFINFQDMIPDIVKFLQFA